MNLTHWNFNFLVALWSVTAFEILLVVNFVFCGFSYWSPGEPNGVPDRDEDCAEVKDYYLTDSWNDEPCGLKRSWICERTSPPGSKPTIQ